MVDASVNKHPGELDVCKQIEDNTHRSQVKRESRALSQETNIRVGVFV